MLLKLVCLWLNRGDLPLAESIERHYVARVRLLNQQETMVGKHNLVLKVVHYSEAATEIQAIRQAVFQIEQNVEPSLDFDGLDEAALHVVAYWNDHPAGTARLRLLNNRLAKVERVAVLSIYRGQGIGQAVMEAALAFLSQQGVTDIKLNAQVQTKSFYEKLGFQPRGEEFEEAGIRHIEMYRSHYQN